jgi:hypothetical protein
VVVSGARVVETVVETVVEVVVVMGFTVVGATVDEAVGLEATCIILEN